MKDRKGNYLIIDESGKVVKASKIKEITAENNQMPYCTAELENGKRITLPMKLSQAFKYLKTICNQKTLGQ